MIPELGAAQPVPSQILLSEAVSFAGSQGYSFDPMALAELQMFLAEAAERSIASSGVEQISDLLDIVQELQPHVFQFVALTIDSAKQSGTEEKVLEEPHLQAAKHRFCPLFPFC